MKPTRDNDRHSSVTQEINSTFLRRVLTLLALKVKQKAKNRDSSIYYISRNLCIKVGDRLSLAEAHAMQFVSQNTSIPVPRVYCAFKRKRFTYIVMQRLEGRKLAQGWLERTDASRAKILSKLRSMVLELQAITPPKDRGISNVLGGSIWNPTIAGSTEDHGPFINVQDFHNYLHQGVTYHPDNHSKVNELLELHKQDWPIRFTHGDLSSLNILVLGEEITGIVDWETAGWLPSYWEYTSACFVNSRNLFWRNYVDSFIDPNPDALYMDTLRNDLFGQFGCVI